MGNGGLGGTTTLLRSLATRGGHRLVMMTLCHLWLTLTRRRFRRTAERRRPLNSRSPSEERERQRVNQTRYVVRFFPAPRLRGVMILCGLATLLGLGLRTGDGLRPPVRPPSRPNDGALHTKTIEQLHNADSYYEVVGEELRRTGYPTRSVFNWRTPAHYQLIAWVTIERAAIMLRCLIVAAVAGTIWGFARESLSRCVAAGLLTLGGMLMPLMIGAVQYGEVCAGTLIGLSLALYSQARWLILAACLGIAAVFLREIAVPYALTCGVLAIIHRRRAESITWVLGGIAYVTYYAVHAINVSQHIRPTDFAHSESWLQFGGLTFVLQTLHGSGWLVLMPMWVTPVACVLALAATCAPSISPNVKWSLLIYFAFFSVAGHPFNFYWGMGHHLDLVLRSCPLCRGNAAPDERRRWQQPGRHVCRKGPRPRWVA